MGYYMRLDRNPRQRERKPPGNMDATRMCGDVVKIDNSVVKVNDTASRCHLRSLQWDVDISERNVNDDGNTESKPIDEIPW